MWLLPHWAHMVCGSATTVVAMTRAAIADSSPWGCLQWKDGARVVMLICFSRGSVPQAAASCQARCLAPRHPKWGCAAQVEVAFG
jgi:hypothetical protein